VTAKNKTHSGRENLYGKVTEVLPYPGAKPCFLLKDQWKNSECFSELVCITAEALPASKPEKKERQCIWGWKVKKSGK